MVLGKLWRRVDSTVGFEIHYLHELKTFPDKNQLFIADLITTETLWYLSNLQAASYLYFRS